MATEQEKPQTIIENEGIGEKLPSGMTREQLNKLRHEVERGEISKKPEEYNFPDTEIAPAEKVADILEKIFSEKGKNVPAGSIARIELALSAQGLDLEKMNAARFRVESGKLIIYSVGGQHVTFDLLPWKVLEGKETEEVLSGHEYELGKYEGGAPLTEDPDKIEAGVDATNHGVQAREAMWYEEKSKSAKLLLDTFNANKDRFDAATQKLIDDHKDILTDLGTQTDFAAKNFKKNFEKKYGKDKVFGPDGVYNLVLAFQRVLDVYAFDDAEQRLQDGNNKFVISLVIGATIKKQSERYVKAIAGSVAESDEGGTIFTPVAVPPVKAPESGEGAYMRVQPKNASLAPGLEQFNESMTPAVASEKLITEYKTNGLASFQAGLLAIASNDPQEAETVLETVFEKLRATDRETAVRLMSEIANGQSSAIKAQIDASLKEAIEKEQNPENKKVLELMKLLNDIKYNAENPQATPDTEARAKEGGANEMRTILNALAAIDGSKLTGEYKEFYETTKKSLSDRMRQSMSADILETSRNSLEGALLDRTKSDTTITNSLEELRKMDKEALAKSLRNEGISNWVDSDAEVYLASCHVMEAMRLYLTYLYPQEVAKGTAIQNPLKWALEQVKAGKEIGFPQNFKPSAGDVYEDAFTGKSQNVPAGTFNPDTLFVAKDAELRIFEAYQKGDQRVGEASVWNLAPTTLWGGMLTGGALGAISAASGANERLHTDKGAFMARGGGMIEGSETLFAKDVTQFMSDKGQLGPVETLELRKINHLRETKNYDEARALSARIIVDKMPPINDADISKRATEISKDYDSKIRAQVRLMMEKDERFKGLDYSKLNAAIDKATKEAIEERSFLQLVGEKAATMDESKLSDFEKAALRTLNIMNGNALIPLSDESIDVVISVSKVVLEIAAIEIVTMGMGTFIAGAAGVGAVAEAGATGFSIARSTGLARRAFTAGEALAESAGTAGRLTRILARNRAVAGGVGWVAEGGSMGARATGTVIHAAAFSEGMHMMHGSTLQVIDDPKGAAWEVGTTALTMWGLGATQRFMRGQIGRVPTPALVAREGAAVEGAIATGGARGVIGRTSSRVGEFLADKPLLRHPAEIGTELVVLHNIGRIEKWGAVQTGAISQLQADAMEDPVVWHEYAHTAGVVLGLRAWGVAQQEIARPPEPKQLTGRILGEPPQLTGERLGETPQLKGERLGEVRALPEISATENIPRLLEVRQVIFGERTDMTAGAKEYLELMNRQVSAHNYSKESLEEAVRRIYDIPPEKVLNNETWNTLTIRKIAVNVHPDQGGDPSLFSALTTFTASARKALLG